MVCKECGTYNAENLTHCRVCSAKLRDDDAVSPASAEPKQDAKPAREFVHAPAWPTRAFSGAPETKPTAKTPDAEDGIKPTASAAYRPSSIRQSSAPSCPYCGKPGVSGAPFCPYCGERMDGSDGKQGEEASVIRASSSMSRAAAAKPAAPDKEKGKAPIKRATDFDDDEFEDSDEEDEFDEKPASKKAAKPQHGKKSAHHDDYDDEDDDEFDDEDEFDDDDDYDDDEFDDDDEDMPKKKNKSTTILFVGLIVLLIALIAVFGMYIAKKNFGGSIGAMFASIGTIFNKDGGNSVTAPDAQAPTSDNAALMNTATITEFTSDDTGEPMYAIDIYAKTGSTIRIVTEATLETDAATVSANDHVILHIARDVFMPNAPCESSVVTITPNIQVVNSDGTTTPLSVPEMTVTIPSLSMTVTAPEFDSVTASYGNEPISIMGKVDNYDSSIGVYVNNEQIYVNDMGEFNTSYVPKFDYSSSATTVDTTATAGAATAGTAADGTATDGTATDGTATDGTTTDATSATDTTSATDATSANDAQTITIEARKSNCVTARKVITVEPYVVQNMSLLLTNDLATGLTSTDGSLTLQGTATPNAKIIATCTSDKVTFGEATVSTTGSFTMAVSIAEVGAFDIKLSGSLEGYNEASYEATIERKPTDKSSTFRKACTDISKSYAQITAGSVTSGNFTFTGKVTEIIATSPYTIFKIQLTDGTEVVCVNRSESNTINSADVKQKKQIAGTLKGLYTDGQTPYIWAWFIWNK